MRKSGAILFLILVAGSGGLWAGPGAEKEVAAVLDDWHQAASEAAGDRYFGHFAPDGVFLGTDGGERWTVEAFRAYAEPYFSRGRGWTYHPEDRHVGISVDGKLAWFDEKLRSEKYGELRGTGVLRRTKGGWKIVQYNMTFTIPNDLSKKVVALIRGE